MQIEVRLVTISPLSIGSGAQQGTLARQGLLKDRDGWPYVPASAFKGCLRHAVERVARALNLQPAVCVTHHDMCRRELCPACQLFGSPWAAGALAFPALTLDGPPAVMVLKEGSRDASFRSRSGQKHPRTTQRMGVSLNRRRRVAEDALLFSTELLWPGLELEYHGVLSGNLTLAQAALLVAGLRLLPAMGRSKSSGLGWIRVELTVKKEDETVVDEVSLRAALQSSSAVGGDRP